MESPHVDCLMVVCGIMGDGGISRMEFWQHGRYTASTRTEAGGLEVEVEAESLGIRN